MPDDDGDDPVPTEGRFPQESGHIDSPKYSEPEEFDPHDLGPPIPEAPDPTDSDVDIDPGTHALFWGLVLVFNAALLLLSLGVMFAAFEGNYDLGAQLFAVGAILFGYGYYRYRRFTREKDDDGEDDDGEDDDGEDDDGEDDDGEDDDGEDDDGADEDAENDDGEDDDGEDEEDRDDHKG